ncbi:hypothetical protein AVEN_113288-1, partial [Araneus ventricosus]
NSLAVDVNLRIRMDIAYSAKMSTIVQDHLQQFGAALRSDSCQALRKRSAGHRRITCPELIVVIEKSLGDMNDKIV